MSLAVATLLSLLLGIVGSVASVAIARMPVPSCSCGHSRDAHEHHRRGRECVGRVPRTAIDGRPWSKPCGCLGYRRPSLLARLLRGAR